MRVDIGNGLKYYENWSENTLPKVSESFESIFYEQGRGQLVEAFFEFDSEKVFFQIKMDGEIVADIDIDKLKDFRATEFCGNYPSIGYNYDNKILYIKFQLPIQFNQSLEFLAKTNDGNKTKKLKGYQVIVNKEAE